MKVDKTKLYLAVGEPSRYAINGIYLDTEAKKLIATNGKAMAVLPVEVEEGDSSAIINADVWKEKRGKNEGIVASVGEKTTLPNGKVFNNIDGTYPKYKEVIPNYSDTVTLIIDPKLLWKLAQAMGYNEEYKGFKLEIPVPQGGGVVNDGVKVLNQRKFLHGEGQAIGVIMPTSWT